MSAYPEVVTVLDRLLTAGLARHAAVTAVRYGRVYLDGQPVTQAHTPVAPGQQVTVNRAPYPEVIA
jgi:hypothetical protein